MGISLASAAIAFAYSRTGPPSDTAVAAGLVLAVGLLGALTAADRPDREGLIRAMLACALGIVVGSLPQGLVRTSLLLLVFAVGRVARMVQLERGAAKERNAAAVIEERARIARDLHDVIAHSLGVVIVQVQAAERVMETDPVKARAALVAAAAVGRNALDEMHRMVGVMRGGDRRAPQPSLSDLSELVDQSKAAGIAASLVVDEEPGASDLSPGVQVAAYRIVQEALTNAAHHAAGGKVEVHVWRRQNGISMDIADSGGRRQHVTGGGFGIEGMRERVATYGGTLEAGPRGDGFAVRAWLPATKV